jgi:hypothetical protein
MLGFENERAIALAVGHHPPATASPRSTVRLWRLPRSAERQQSHPGHQASSSVCSGVNG